MLPLIKIVKCMIDYFIGPITLRLVPVVPECMLQMSTCACLKRGIYAQASPKPYSCGAQMLADMCPWGQHGEKCLMLCGGLCIKLHISNKTQFKVMMDEVA